MAVRISNVSDVATESYSVSAAHIALAVARPYIRSVLCSFYPVSLDLIENNISKMSHVMTFTRTTVSTTGTSSAMYVNTGALCSMPGFLKLAQLLLGSACVGVVSYYADREYLRFDKPQLFFLLIAVAFLIGTFCLLTSYLVSFSTASMISKTVYEVIYHGLAAILYLVAGLYLLIEVNHQKNYYRGYDHYMAAAIMGLILAGLYFLSTVLALRHYRGI